MMRYRMKITIKDIMINIKLRNKKFDIIIKEKMINITIKTMLFILISIAAILLGAFGFVFFDVNESQNLYLFSTSSQVVAGLYGLILAGYIFSVDRMKKDVKDDDSLYDMVEILKKEFNFRVIEISIVCFLTILLSALSIVVKTDGVNENFHNMLFNETVIIYIVTVFLIINFVIKVLDPRKITKISEAGRGKDDSGDLAEYLKDYNAIQNIVISTANRIIGYNSDNIDIGYNKYIKKDNGYKPQIFQALKILLSKEIISKDIEKDINSVRQYRNFAVHSDVLFVSKEMTIEISKVLEAIETLVNEYNLKTYEM